MTSDITQIWLQKRFNEQHTARTAVLLGGSVETSGTLCFIHNETLPNALLLEDRSLLHHDSLCVKTGRVKTAADDSIMKWGCCLYTFAYLSTLSEAQGEADGCVTCALGDFFKSGLEEWILPAVGALQFLVPGSGQGPDTTIPETDPKKHGTNNLPGSVDQFDIEIESTASPDKKCDPNGAQVSVILLP